jgi:hypothetical protein
MMKMFRNELLDLKEILEYIKMQPSEDATSTTVRPLGKPACMKYCV